MARTISIPLTDALEAQIRAEAAARGSRSLDECALDLLKEALSLPARMPTDPGELEAELRKGLQGPHRAPTQEDWARKKADLAARHTRSKAG